MSRNTYLTTHHGSFWFQIRVPVAHQPRYGLRVRTNLQTNDPAAAKTLALRLASDWLVRFSHPPETPLPVYLLTASAPRATSADLGVPARADGASPVGSRSGHARYLGSLATCGRYARAISVLAGIEYGPRPQHGPGVRAIDSHV